MAAPRVLLIDDDAPIARLMSLSMELDGMTVDWCSSRDKAIEVLDAGVPDAVVMDYLMPGMDAGSFVALLHARGFSGPLFVCTGYEGELDLAATLIRKPFDPDELVAKMRDALGQSA